MTTTHTYNTIEFADPFKRCDVCHERVAGVLCVTEGVWPNLPCDHVGCSDTCPSWGPNDGTPEYTDGCTCLRVFGYVPHAALSPSYKGEQ